MDKKKRNPERPAPSPVKQPPTQAVLKLPHEELERVRRVAKQRGLALAAFLRATILKEVERIEEGRD
jgi:predicted DNA-binding protein